MKISKISENLTFLKELRFARQRNRGGPKCPNLPLPLPNHSTLLKTMPQAAGKKENWSTVTLIKSVIFINLYPRGPMFLLFNFSDKMLNLGWPCETFYQPLAAWSSEGWNSSSLLFWGHLGLFQF